MLRGLTRRALQAKKMNASSFLAQSGKTGSEEKFAQAAMEYIYERKAPNDARKRQNDVDAERGMSVAFDRYCAHGEAVYEQRLERLLTRAVEALEAIPEALLDEAVLLNSQQPPLNYARPSLTPPVAGFEPGYGIDVPQLRTDIPEFPKVVRPTDTLEFGEAAETTFPFVDTGRLQTFAADYAAKLEKWHGGVRKEEPATGTDGEGWEAYVALNKKAVARQQLILDLCNDPELKERYDSDEVFRERELRRRHIMPLIVDDEEAAAEALTRPRTIPTPAPPLHYAQEPKYEPFRKM